MSDTQNIPVAGSDREPMAGAQYVSPIQQNEQVHVTLIVRRRGAQPDISAFSFGEKSSRAKYGADLGADPNDFDEIEQFAHNNGLTVVERHEASRRIVLAGPADKIQQAFDVQLGTYDVPARGIHYRGRKGEVCLPSHIHPAVIAVLGLDNRPIAKPHMRRSKAAAPAAFNPPQLAQLYNFPPQTDGSGETVAIIELGGGYRTNDLNTYFKGLGITPPSVTSVSVDGGTNTPGSDADGEVMLDIEVVGAMAPGAKIVVYFAPNTDRGFVDAISQAVHDSTHNPSLVSISWGASEDTWTDQAKQAMNAAFQDAAALGVTVTVAAGDDGSSDGANDGKLHVDFPAASPYALSCGGTKVLAAGGKITSETVWNELTAKEGATGGGVSKSFPIPTYQSAAGVPPQPETQYKGRGVPDVAGNADPSTGFNVLVDGKPMVIGGTSAVAPLWAALLARINQQLGKPVGFVNPLLYQAGSPAFNDITSGNNGYYKAGKGWDACTGLGSPSGVRLLNALKGGAQSRSTPAPAMAGRDS